MPRRAKKPALPVTPAGRALAERIRGYMLRLNMTETELVARSGLVQSTVHRILRGQTADPGIQTLKPIARVLGTTTDYLGSGEAPDERVAAILEAAALRDHLAATVGGGHTLTRLAAADVQRLAREQEPRQDGHGEQ